MISDQAPDVSPLVKRKMCKLSSVSRAAVCEESREEIGEEQCQNTI